MGANHPVRHRDQRCKATPEEFVAALERPDWCILDLDPKGAPFKNVLASAIGSDEALPEIVKFDISVRGSLILMCSDGLTKHVSDDEIADSIRKMETSEQCARHLLEMALERGGQDNITIIAARALPQPGQ